MPPPIRGGGIIIKSQRYGTNMQSVLSFVIDLASDPVSLLDWRVTMFNQTLLQLIDILHDSPYPADYKISDAVLDPVDCTNPKASTSNVCYTLLRNCQSVNLTLKLTLLWLYKHIDICRVSQGSVRTPIRRDGRLRFRLQIYSGIRLRKIVEIDLDLTKPLRKWKGDRFVSPSVRTRFNCCSTAIQVWHDFYAEQRCASG